MLCSHSVLLLCHLHYTDEVQYPEVGEEGAAFNSSHVKHPSSSLHTKHTPYKFFSGSWASQVAIVVKNLPANAGDIRDVDLIPELARSPGGRYGNPLQYSSLENLMDREAWWATVHRF